MRRTLLTLVLLLSGLTAAGAALACDKFDWRPAHSTWSDSPTRFAERHDSYDARIAIESRDGYSMLVLTDEVAAVQLSDRALRKIQRKLRAEQDSDDDNTLARVIKVAVLSGVRDLLAHSAECPIRELRDVEYRQGRLIFTTEDGDRVFERMEVKDEDVLSGFSERDARAFVREFRKLKAMEDR